MDKVNKEESELLQKIIKRYPQATNNDLKIRDLRKLSVCEINILERKRVCVPGQRRVEQSII